MTAQSVTPTFTASRRDFTGKKVKQLRTDGKIPAVVYGHKKESISLTLDGKSFGKLFEEVGSSTLINLVVDDEKPFKVLIQDVQETAIRNHILHVDFYQVNLKEKLRTNIPLEFVGTSAAVEELDGTLITSKDEVEIECLPDNLIQHIEVDISVLATFEDTIRVADLKVPETITILDDPEDMIAAVTEPISEEELAALDEAPVAEVETEFATEDGATAEPGEETPAPAEEKKED